MKKFVYFIIILIILAAGYYFYAQKNKQVLAPTVENGALEPKTDETADKKQETNPQPPQSPTTTPPQGGGTQAEATFSAGEGDILAPDILVVQVDYDGTKFSPASADVKVGDIVIFKNNSDGQMWPASAPHPTHTAYPEFDAKQSIAPGGKWQFKFEKAGAWKYHDHLNAEVGGVVNVSSK